LSEIWRHIAWICIFIINWGVNLNFRGLRNQVLLNISFFSQYTSINWWSFASLSFAKYFL